jgi:hypothetical protein
MQSVKKETDGFLRLRVTEEIPTQEDYSYETKNDSSFFDFPEELAAFLGGLNGKRKR